MLTPTEMPPNVTGGALTGTGRDGSGTVTVVVASPPDYVPDPPAAGFAAVVVDGTVTGTPEAPPVTVRPRTEDSLCLRE